MTSTATRATCVAATCAIDLLPIIDHCLLPTTMLSLLAGGYLVRIVGELHDHTRLLSLRISTSLMSHAIPIVWIWHILHSSKNRFYQISAKIRSKTFGPATRILDVVLNKVLGSE